MTFVNLNGAAPPARGSREWEKARRLAYNPKNPVYKGDLGDLYPGYASPQHVRDCAVLTWQIIERAISKGTWKKHPHIVARNYQIYLDHCSFGGMTPRTNTIVTMCFHNEERQEYFESTGKIVLPMECYYDNEWGIDDIKTLLPEDAWSSLDKLYSHDRGIRINWMRAGESRYRQWRDRKKVVHAKITA